MSSITQDVKSSRTTFHHTIVLCVIKNYAHELLNTVLFLYSVTANYIFSFSVQALSLHYWCK